MRSEHIRLNSYFFRRNVPEVESPKFPCEYPSQNKKHTIMSCPLWSKGRGELTKRAKNRSFVAMMNSLSEIDRITEWITKEGWLEQFRFAGAVEKSLIEKGRYKQCHRPGAWR